LSLFLRGGRGKGEEGRGSEGKWDGRGEELEGRFGPPKNFGMLS